MQSQKTFAQLFTRIFIFTRTLCGANSQYLPHGKTAKEVAKTVNYLLMPYENHVHSITTDNGLEFAEHKWISKKLEAIVYFTHPYSFWEKGQIENMNKLFRQYIPKKEVINQDNTMNLKETSFSLINIW